MFTKIKQAHDPDISRTAYISVSGKRHLFEWNFNPHSSYLTFFRAAFRFLSLTLYDERYHFDRLFMPVFFFPERTGSSTER